jgi:histidine ammonia-lyase
VVAIELLCACQALDCDPGRAGDVVEALHDAVRERVPTLTQDRPPAEDLRDVLKLMEDGTPARLLTGADR